MYLPFEPVVTVDVAVEEIEEVAEEDAEDVAVDEAVLVCDVLPVVDTEEVAVVDAVLVADALNDVVAVVVRVLVAVVELLYVQVGVDVCVVLTVVVAELLCVDVTVDVTVVVGDVNLQEDRSTVPLFNAVSARLIPLATASHLLYVRRYPVAAHRTSEPLLKMNVGNRSMIAVVAPLHPDPAMCRRPFWGLFVHLIA